MNKEEQINAEIKRLNRIFKNLPDDKKKLCKKLISNAAYMSATLDELQEAVNADGAIFESKNGNGFDIIQEHPANRAYTQLIAKYTGVINQLNSFLPDAKTEGVNKAGESLAKFIAKGK